LRALRHVQERTPDVPVIVVTGALSDEAAVACIKQGAADYLLKDRLDPLRLEQVLTNLVGNAIRYSPQGGSIALTLAVDPGGATVHHALAVDERSGHVFVANTYGTPASPSVLSRLVARSRPWLPAWGQQWLARLALPSHANGVVANSVRVLDVVR
jgi:signal transduction histidine kinase